MTIEKPTRRRRSDGERSRNAILREATQLATVEGIDGLSIGGLADAVGMSKSGLYAHFGSKEELQLATIDAAGSVYNELVVEPALSAPSAQERLRQLLENFLRHLENDVFPGGCFFASVAAEMDTRPGPVRDRAVQFTQIWFGLLVRAVQDAQAEGQIDAAEDPVQLAFELDAYILLANAQHIATGESQPIELARRALDRRLAAAAA